MKRSRLKNKANLTRNPTDIRNYKKQRNMVVKLKRQSKLEYFEKISNFKTSKPFWDTCKPYFSNKNAKGNSNFMLIERDKILVKNGEIANEFSKYFEKVAYELELYKFPSESTEHIMDKTDCIVYKFGAHHSIQKIR